MKRILALVCLLALCLPLCACSSGLAPSETVATEENKTVSQQKTEEKTKDDKITYPEGFSVGYAIADISMVPVPIYEGTAKTIHDPIMLTCTAVCDGENVALLMSADLKSIQRGITESSRKIITKKFGIPAENVIINATHTHNAHTAGGTTAELTRWSTLWYKQLEVVVEEALRDLAPAQAYVGVGHTESLTFVRRYLLANGKYQTNANSAANPVAHESEADNELRTLRFKREGKKDVLMVNYQTHYGGATGMYPDQLSADFITPFRDRAQKELDCLFVYHSGASGNLNFNSPIPGEKIYPDFIQAIDGFMKATNEALSKEEPANTGKIVTKEENYVATVFHDSDEVVKQAKEIDKVGSETEAGVALRNKYGLGSKRHINAIITRAGMDETQDIPLCAITFGDIAFTAFPYEMFDKNGKDCREASPYKMTFVCSLANGANGYIPTTEAFPHGSYEVVVCRYVQGTGEALVDKMVSLLNDCKNNA
ncbi:MAG: hypothetical protein IJC26_05135 [Clostridia bacterium]|nr:hypothetical protein [Clostridia bacterium]